MLQGAIIWIFWIQAFCLH